LIAVSFIPLFWSSKTSRQRVEGGKKLSLKLALQALKRLGLTEVDALVYIQLEKKGPQEERDLADSLQTTDQQICYSLRSLQEKGFVTSRTKKQTLFFAAPLEKVIDNILKAKTEEMQRIGHEKEDFLSKLNRQL
jgi:sugar-specific transcriptional regulator TrmB